MDRTGTEGNDNGAAGQLEALIGTILDDTLAGLGGDDRLDGLAGFDVLDGGAGVDTLIGGAGDDTLRGGDDVDTYLFDSGFGTDRIEDSENGAVIRFGVGITLSDITIARDPGAADLLITVNAADTITVVNHFDGIDETAEPLPVLVRIEFADNSVLSFADGTPSITGPNDDVFVGGSSADTVFGGLGNDSLFGGASTDSLLGEGGNDTVEGGDDDDILVGGADDDTLDGGAGQDVAEFAGQRQNYAITVDPNGGPGDYLVHALDGNEGVDVLRGVEIARFADQDIVLSPSIAGITQTTDAAGGTSVGTVNDDVLIGLTGNDTIVALGGTNSVRGGAGDDSITAGIGVDRLFGDAGNDTLSGGDASDTLLGGANDDSLSGGAGNDSLLGEDGDDIVNGGDGDDRIGQGSNVTDLGNDTLLGGIGQDTLSDINGINEFDGGDGNDQIFGTGDSFIGGSGDDQITARATRAGSIIDAGEGNDNIFIQSTQSVSSEGVLILGDIGNDTIRSGQLDDTIDGGSDNDTISADAGADSVTGGGGTDTIDGGLGNDTIDGGDDGDELRGGAGDDVIEGGEGDDIAVYSGVFDDYELTAGQNNFTIRDLRASSVDGEDTVSGVERLRFADGENDVLTLLDGGDVDGTPGDDVGVFRLTGTVANDILRGFAGNDELEGLDGNDLLQGGPDNDTLIGGIGDDTLEGGAGIDIAIFSSTRADYSVDGLTFAGETTVTDNANSDGSDVLTGVRILRFTDQDIVINTAPVAVNDALNPVAEDNGPYILGPDLILGNDTDAENDNLTVIAASLDVGDAVILSDGNIRISLPVDYEGPVVLTYDVSDGFVTDQATATFDVLPVNDNPAGVNDEIVTDEDTAISTTVLGEQSLLSNDIEPDGDPIFVVGVNGNPNNVGQPVTLDSGALITINADGTFELDPNGAFETLNVGESVTDNFTYVLADDTTGAGQATVNITINGVTDVLQAGDDQFATDEETPFTLPSVLDNDGPDDGALNVVSIEPVDPNDTRGTLTLANGNLTYDPGTALQFLGEGVTRVELFTYTVQNSAGDLAAGTIAIEVTGRNDAPGLVPISDAVVFEGSRLEGTVFLTDPDDEPITVTVDYGDGTPIETINTRGAATDATIRPTIKHAYFGEGVYTVIMTADDGAGLANSVEVNTFDVTVVNANPVANNDFYITSAGRALSGNVLDGSGGSQGRDTDAGGDTLTVTNIGTFEVPGAGVLTLEENGDFTFDPNDEFETLSVRNSEIVEIDYEISDGDDGFATATVSIRVFGGRDDAPAPITGDLSPATSLQGDQVAATVVAAGSGRSMVVWVDRDGGDELMARILDSSGLPVGNSFAVSSNVLTSQHAPNALAIGEDTVVVSWDESVAVGEDALYLRFFQNGTPTSDVILAVDSPEASQRTAAMAETPDGGFLLVWTSVDNATGSSSIEGQFYSSDGLTVGDVFAISDGGLRPDFARVAVADTGAFFVTWQEDGTDGDGASVVGRAFDATNVPVGDVTVLTTEAEAFQTRPDVAALPTGDFALVWQSYDTDGAFYDIFVRLINADGTFKTLDALATTITASTQEDARIAVLNDGGFVVSWTSLGEDGLGRGVFAQRFDSAGEKLGAVARLNQITEGDQVSSDLALIDDGILAAVWTTDSRAFAGTDIAARYFSVGSNGENDMTASAASAPEATSEFATTTRISNEQVTAFETPIEPLASAVKAPENVNGEPLIVFAALAPEEEAAAGAAFGATPDDDSILGTGEADLIAGLEGNDTIEAGEGDDSLAGGAGDDSLDGGAGNDTALFSGNRSDYLIEGRAGTGPITVTDLLSEVDGDDGVDTLIGIERLEFDNVTIAARTGGGSGGGGDTGGGDTGSGDTGGGDTGGGDTGGGDTGGGDTGGGDTGGGDTGGGDTGGGDTGGGDTGGGDTGGGDTGGGGTGGGDTGGGDAGGGDIGGGDVGGDDLTEEERNLAKIIIEEGAEEFVGEVFDHMREGTFDKILELLIDDQVADQLQRQRLEDIKSGIRPNSDYDGTRAFVKDALSKFGSLRDDLFDVAAAKFKKYGNLINAVEAAFEVLITYEDTGTSLTDAIKDFGNALVDAGVNIIVDGFILAGAAFAAGGSAIAAGILGFGGLVLGQIFGVGDGIADFLKDPIGTLDDLADRLGDLLEPFRDNPGLLWPAIQDLFDRAEEMVPRSDPIVLDLDGDGLELIDLENSSVFFDLDADGFAERTGWVRPDDGLLVLDKNGDGIVNDVSELFGSTNVDGFAELATFDENRDLTIDAQDAVFDQIRVWRDLNGDGNSQEDEVFTLEELGITSFDINYRESNYVTSNNLVTQVSTFETAGGTRNAYDVWFQLDELSGAFDPNSTFADPYELNTSALLLPQMRGYGTLPDLYIAMSSDQLLMDLVGQIAFAGADEFGEFRTRVEEILFHWTGVDDRAGQFRNFELDERIVGSLEVALGQTFENVGGGNQPLTPNASRTIEEAFELWVDRSVASFLVQSDFSGIFEEQAEYDFVADAPSLTGSLETIIDRAIGETPLDASSEALDFWVLLRPVLDIMQPDSTLSSGAYLDYLEVAFANSSVGFNIAELESAITGIPISNDEAGQSFFGTDGNDVFDAGVGADTFFVGDIVGRDVIIAPQDPNSPPDTIVLGASIEPDDIVIIAEDGRLIIRRLDGVGEIVVEAVFDGDGIPRFAVNTIEFADGTTIDLSGGLVLQGTDDADVLSGASFGDEITGRGNDDELNGRGGDDTISGNQGNDTINGGAGNDVALYSGPQSDYDLSYDVGAFEAQGSLTIGVTDLRIDGDGSDELVDIEALQFGEELQKPIAGLAIANDDVVRVAYNSSYEFYVWQNDQIGSSGGGEAEIIGDGVGLYGVLTLGSSNGRLDYSAGESPLGAGSFEDYFQYQLTNAAGEVDTAQLRVVVTDTAGIPRPTANDDAFSVVEGTEFVGNVLANDFSGSDGYGALPVLDARIEESAAGTLTLGADGNYSYVVKSDLGLVEQIEDRFSYTLIDASGDVSSAELIVSVLPSDGPASPLAINDSYSTEEDVELTIGALGVLENDTVGESDVSIVSGPDFGNLTFSSDGSFIYTPNRDVFGEDSFIYQLAAPGGDVSQATVTVTVTPVNDAPVANADSDTVAEDGGVTIAVLDNDTDIDSALDPISVEIDGADIDMNGKIKTVAGEGIWSVMASGEISFAPETGYTGPVADITYIVTDAEGLRSDAVAVSVTITGENDAPVATPDAPVGDEDTVISGQVTATDVDGDIPTFALSTEPEGQPANGTVVVNDDGSYDYTPASNFNGTDSFDVTADDGNGGTDTLTVTVTVTPVNDAPVALDDTGFSTAFDAALEIDPANLLANDTDADQDTLSISSVQALSGGTAVLSQGVILFTPTPGFSGTAEFEYSVSDGGETASATVAVTVEDEVIVPNSAFRVLLVNSDTDAIVGEIVDGVLDPALLEGERFAIAAEYIAGGEESISLQLDDEDAQIESVAPYALFGNRSGGNFQGRVLPDDPFTLTLEAYSDNRAEGTLLAAETITIIFPGAILSPIAANDTASTGFEEAVLIDVLANDVDADDALTITDLGAPSNDDVVLSGDQVLYTPDIGFSGIDSFTYEITGGDETATATVNVTVDTDGPPPPPPENGVFVESGGLLVIEAESGELNSNWRDIDSYSLQASPNLGNPDAATGDDFIVWQGSQVFNSVRSGNIIEYDFYIENPGTYAFQWRSQVSNGGNSTEHNDSWLKTNADQFYANDINSNGVLRPAGAAAGTFPDGAEPPDGASDDGFFKLYSTGLTNWTWRTFTSDNDSHLVFADFDTAGFYSLEIAARSSSHAIDRFVLSNVDDFTREEAQDLGLPESNFVDPDEFMF
ncbi:Ig-like domain-containing protein [Rhodobacteraceae bacterium]|nr:Ig-like domain-containing protein [Paracoccaceae bacterium]